MSATFRENFNHADSNRKPKLDQFLKFDFWHDQNWPNVTKCLTYLCENSSTALFNHCNHCFCYLFSIKKITIGPSIAGPFPLKWGSKAWKLNKKSIDYTIKTYQIRKHSLVWRYVHKTKIDVNRLCGHRCIFIAVCLVIFH